MWIRKTLDGIPTALFIIIYQYIRVNSLRKSKSKSCVFVICTLYVHVHFTCWWVVKGNSWFVKFSIISVCFISDQWFSVFVSCWSVHYLCQYCLFADEFDAYIIVSFVNATLVLSIGETVEEVTDSGFLGTTPTLSCSQLGDDALVQVMQLPCFVMDLIFYILHYLLVDVNVS